MMQMLIGQIFRWQISYSWMYWSALAIEYIRSNLFYKERPDKGYSDNSLTSIKHTIGSPIGPR